jgi:hypothetical protein
MRKFLIIVLGIVSLALLVSVVWPFETRLTEGDMQAIIAQVRQQTKEPIMSVRPLVRWRVYVETGEGHGGLSGGGHYFYVGRGWRGWRIYQSGSWVG